MSLGSLCSAMTSAPLVAGVSLVSMLQAGDWTGVSALARHYLSIYITAVDWYKDPVQCVVLASVSRWFLGKCLTLIYIYSLVIIGLLGNSCPQYWADSFPIVNVVLAPDGWNYWSGDQGLTDSPTSSSQCLHHMASLKKRKYASCDRGRYQKVAAPYFV